MEYSFSELEKFNQKIRELNPEVIAYPHCSLSAKEWYTNPDLGNEFELEDSIYDVPSFVNPITRKDAFGTQY